jgi:hypothetical protein
LDSSKISSRQTLILLTSNKKSKNMGLLTARKKNSTTTARTNAKVRRPIMQPRKKFAHILRL